MLKSEGWIRLSYTLSQDTPAYGGAEGLMIERVKDMSCGDSCNTVSLAFSNHLGSHVDAPKHFVESGKSVDQYEIEDWIFDDVLCVDVPVPAGEVVTCDHLSAVLEGVDDTSFLLIRTGFYANRGKDLYWSTAPAFDPSLAAYLKERLPSLTAIGLDTISISSLCHRDMGREAHREFLGRNIRIFEDLALGEIPKGKKLQQVIALPLMFENADGAPCTIIGVLA